MSALSSTLPRIRSADAKSVQPPFPLRLSSVCGTGLGGPATYQNLRSYLLDARNTISAHSALAPNKTENGQWKQSAMPFGE